MRRRDKIPILIFTTTAGAIVGASVITLLALGTSLILVAPFYGLARKVHRKASECSR